MDLNNLEFRKLGIRDLEMILKMNEDFRPNFIVKENAYEFLLNNMNWIFAAIKDNRIIAFAYGYEVNRLDNKGNMLYIHEVGVIEEYHRQGIGTKLLLKLKELCSLMNICRFFLFTQKSNLPACKLYEQVGGEKISEIIDDDVTYFFPTN